MNFWHHKVEPAWPVQHDNINFIAHCCPHMAFVLIRQWFLDSILRKQFWSPSKVYLLFLFTERPQNLQRCFPSICSKSWEKPVISIACTSASWTAALVSVFVRRAFCPGLTKRNRACRSRCCILKSGHFRGARSCSTNTGPSGNRLC